MAQGRAFLAAGDHAQARISAKRALALAEERGEPPQRAYALKLLGDASLAKGDRSEAQSYLERALELATKCDMRPLMDQCRPALELIARRALYESSAILLDVRRAAISRNARIPGRKK